MIKLVLAFIFILCAYIGEYSKYTRYDNGILKLYWINTAIIHRVFNTSVKLQRAYKNICFTLFIILRKFYRNKNDQFKKNYYRSYHIQELKNSNNNKTWSKETQLKQSKTASSAHISDILTFNTIHSKYNLPNCPLLVGNKKKSIHFLKIFTKHAIVTNKNLYDIADCLAYENNFNKNKITILAVYKTRYAYILPYGYFNLEKIEKNQPSNCIDTIIHVCYGKYIPKPLPFYYQPWFYVFISIITILILYVIINVHTWYYTYSYGQIRFVKGPVEIQYDQLNKYSNPWRILKDANTSSMKNEDNPPKATVDNTLTDLLPTDGATDSNNKNPGKLSLKKINDKTKVMKNNLHTPLLGV